MKRRIVSLTCMLTLLLSVCVFAACSGLGGKTALKVIIIPKFEVGEMTGDFPGEAQLFYEKYCAGCEEEEIPNMPPTAHFYVNKKTGVGLLVTIATFVVSFFPSSQLSESANHVYVLTLAASFAVSLVIPFVIYALRGRWQKGRSQYHPEHARHNS